ncbi:hypothetical protein N7447_002872 [Penicillium robsamsonii]|uniref:uncharacterized protein n=1 Tax=Penicillium robsamsonii TaxID=1792511 RepID=UPI0025481FCB|nr:uncharacterized protein N7447_002872 [Penicillium robsamsonii]KAJ5836846.1 hypothetical protein N7447_002872 [Penicillium robsamsonii]
MQTHTRFKDHLNKAKVDGDNGIQAMLHEKKKRQKTERNKRLLRWQIVHVHILELIMSCVERTYPSKQIARRARTKEVPTFWKQPSVSSPPED